MSAAERIADDMDRRAAEFQRKADLRTQAITLGYEGPASYCDYAAAAHSCRQIAEHNRRRTDDR